MHCCPFEWFCSCLHQHFDDLQVRRVRFDRAIQYLVLIVASGALVDRAVSGHVRSPLDQRLDDAGFLHLAEKCHIQRSLIAAALGVDVGAGHCQQLLHLRDVTVTHRTVQWRKAGLVLFLIEGIASLFRFTGKHTRIGRGRAERAGDHPFAQPDLVRVSAFLEVLPDLVLGLVAVAQRREFIHRSGSVSRETIGDT